MNEYQKRKAYHRAKSRVEQEKGFYSHLMVYIIVNLALLFINSDFKNQGFENWLEWNLYIVPFFWGIGLLSHGLRTFDLNPIFSKKWEERKIKELMDNQNF